MRSADACMVKAALNDHARDRRRRLCASCVEKLAPRHVIGLIHSELACQECGVKPCHGAMVGG